MSTHAYKKVPAPRLAAFSFVKAVTEFGDSWRCRMPTDLLLKATDDLTFDRREAAGMKLLEEGVLSRIGPPAYVHAYPPMIVDEHGYGYCAVREGYDGAPDSNCPIGVGRTRFQAIADLLDAEEQS